MLLRILTFFVLLFSVLFMPLWVSAILAITSMFYFNVFWEATVLFFISDLLYGVKEAKNSPMIFTSFFVAILFLVILEMLKKKLRFYKK
jgi:hypothetical protein